MQFNPDEQDAALRERVLMRSQAINIDLFTRLATVADDLAAGQHLAALGGIDGFEREIRTMRSFLLLLQE
jgi:hypothetical protein